MCKRGEVGPYAASGGSGDWRACPLLLDAAGGAGGPGAPCGARRDGRHPRDSMESPRPRPCTLQQVPVGVLFEMGHK